ncbi:MAG: hypothetical protein WCL11_30075, partial [Verrucomicrobiota bacterium]
MNLLNAPNEAIERLQSHPAARTLGPIQTWSEEQFYTVVARAYDLPYRRITMADVDGDAFYRHQAFFIRNGQIPIQRLPDILIVTECEPWDEKRLQDLLQEFELGVKRILITQRNYDELLGSLSRYQPEVRREVAASEAPVFFPNAAWDNVEPE